VFDVRKACSSPASRGGSCRADLLPALRDRGERCDHARVSARRNSVARRAASAADLAHSGERDARLRSSTTTLPGLLLTFGYRRLLRADAL
jgi:hypothetical protein